MSIGAYEDNYSRSASAQAIAANLAGRRISWGAVFGGVVMVLAVQILLSLLGIGLGTVDLGQTGGTPSASSLGVGAAIWWGVSYLIALVAGGFVAARLAANLGGFDGVLHGLLAWAFALLVTVYLLSTTLGSVIGGAFSAVSTTLSATGQTIKAAAAPQIAQSAGATPEAMQQKAKDLLGAQPTNADPKTMNAQQAQQEIAANLPKLVTGDDDAKQAARQRIIAIVAAQANITPEEASQRLDKLQAQAADTTNQAVGKAKQVTDTVASGLARASLMAFVALLLGAGSAAVGGGLGARRFADTKAAHGDRSERVPGITARTTSDLAAAGNKPTVPTGKA